MIASSCILGGSAVALGIFSGRSITNVVSRLRLRSVRSERWRALALHDINLPPFANH